VFFLRTPQKKKQKEQTKDIEKGKEDQYVPHKKKKQKEHTKTQENEKMTNTYPTNKRNRKNTENT
jgi:hypothetical protein